MKTVVMWSRLGHVGHADWPSALVGNYLAVAGRSPVLTERIQYLGMNCICRARPLSFLANFLNLASNADWKNPRTQPCAVVTNTGCLGLAVRPWAYIVLSFVSSGPTSSSFLL